MIDTLLFKQYQGVITPLYDLLLLADPSRQMIEQYIHQSDVVTVYHTGQLVGLYVLFPVDAQLAEIRNLAVTPEFQGKGIGQKMLHHAIEYAQQKAFKKLIIGTGNSSVAQLYLYQKMGFRITDIKPDFFTTHYPNPIIENGVVCRDMLVLSKTLT